MALCKTFVPRRLRRRFFDFRDAKWLVPAERCLTLPLAVNRKRFLVPLWVFCLGIVASARDSLTGCGKPWSIELEAETRKGCQISHLPRHSAIDRKHLARYIASRRAGQEQHAGGNVFRQPQPLGWNPLLRFFDDHLAQDLRHLALDKARTDGVDGHLAA